MEIFNELAEQIASRKKTPVEGSYTCKLLSAGENLIIKKLGEENAEYIKAFLTGPDSEVANEAADYIYHLMVSLEYRGISFQAVADVLKERHK